MEPGLRWLHIFYGLTMFINMFSIFYEGPESEYNSESLIHNVTLYLYTPPILFGSGNFGESFAVFFSQ